MTTKADIKIDYDHSILSISNSLLQHFNVEHKYKSLSSLDNILAENYKNVVLLILDGMGIDIMKKNLPENSFLQKHIVCSVSSVFPPTTAAATTAIHSGLPPIASGWLGWMNYFPQYDKIIEVFRNKEFYSGKPIEPPFPAETLLKYKSIYQKIVEQNPDMEYYRAFPAFEPDGAKDFAEICAKIEKFCNADNKRKIISAYWTEPDHAIHYRGADCKEVKRILRKINRNLKNLAEKLHDTLLIITADHGAMDVEQVQMNRYADFCQTFVRPPSLESRFVNFFIKDEKKAEFKRLFQQYFGEDFLLYEREEFLASGILGNGEKNPLVDGFLGNFMAIAFGKRTIWYSTGELAFKPMIAEHAGFSEAELQVPLIIIKQK